MERQKKPLLDRIEERIFGTIKGIIKWILLSYLIVFAIGFILGVWYSNNIIADVVLLATVIVVAYIMIRWWFRRSECQVIVNPNEVRRY